MAEVATFWSSPIAYLFKVFSDPSKVETIVEVGADLVIPDGAPLSPGGGLDDAFKGSGKGLQKLKNTINPLNGNTNCVLCSIALEKKLVSGINEAAGLSSADLNYANTIKSVFPNTKKFFGYGGVKGLDNGLGEISGNSAIIVGNYRSRYVTENYSAHAFNAVKQKDGSFKFLDSQGGKEWSREELNEKFGRFEIFDTRSSQND